MYRVTPDNIQTLQPNEVFVFGSNEAGIHGAGAARQALQWGAEMRRGLGECGQTWAIPTKDRQIKTLPLYAIQAYVKYFVIWAMVNPSKDYLVTEIGCGLAGYEPKDIAPLFKEAYALDNVYLPKRFWEQMGKS